MFDAKINSDVSNVKSYSLRYNKKTTKFPKEVEKILFENNSLRFQRDKVDDAFKLLKGNDFKIYLFIMRETIGYHRHKSALSLKYISNKTGIPESEISKSIKRLKSSPVPFITDHGSSGRESHYLKVYSINIGYEYDPIDQKFVPVETNIPGNVGNIDSNASDFDGKNQELISDNKSTTCENLKSSLEKTSNHIYIEEIRDLKLENCSSKKLNSFSVLSPSFNSFSNSDLFFKGNHFFIPTSFLEELKKDIPGLEKLSDGSIQTTFSEIDSWLEENTGPELLGEKFIIGCFKRNKSIQRFIKQSQKTIRQRKPRVKIEPLADKMYESFKSIYSYYKDKKFGKYLEDNEIFKQRKACQIILSKMRIDFEEQGMIVNDDNILSSFIVLLKGLYEMGVQDETAKYYVNKLSPRYLLTEEAIAMLEKLKTNFMGYGLSNEMDMELSVNNFLQ